jgi:hypothetical protein
LARSTGGTTLTINRAAVTTVASCGPAGCGSANRRCLRYARDFAEGCQGAEAIINRLEAQLKSDSQKSARGEMPKIAPWVREQLEDLTNLLKSDPVKVKSEFCRLNLRTSNKTSRDKPHTLFPYFFGTQFITTVMGDEPSASSGVV